LFKGPTAVAYAKDEVTAAKVIVEFAKGNEKLQVLGGSLDGKKLSVSDVKALATMPSLDELRAKIIGLLNAPASKLVGVLQAPAGQVARVVGAYSKKG
ncbi:MAG: 50S ribosomal protein L10, partial [Alphaproteobacteria bacterium]|nr:50S ribosomal protein L10 [Alphaproteobacteria bacterium]